MKTLRAGINWLQCQEALDVRLTSQLFKFSLAFKNEEIEAMFQQHRMSMFVSQYRICTVLQLMINVLFSVTIVFQYGSPMTSIYKAVLATWLLISLICQQKMDTRWPTLMNLLLVVNCVINQTIFYQFYKTQAHSPPYQYLSNVLYAMSNFLICTSWQCQFLIVLGFYVQYTDFDIAYFLEWQTLVWLMLLLFMMRINNKNIRLVFLNLQKQNKNILACKEIFDQCVPSSIFIIKFRECIKSIAPPVQDNILNQPIENDCEVLYANKFAYQYMGCTNNTQCAQQLELIEVIQKDLERLNLLKILKNQSQENLCTNNSDYALGKDQRQLSCTKIQMASFSTVVNTQQYFDVTIKSCIWEGQKSTLIQMSDTTDKLQHISQLKELNNYKDQLLATVSHDLKTPLNSSQLMLFTIQDTLKNKSSIIQEEIKSIQRYVKDIISNNIMLLTLINDLLDYSQIRQGTLRLQVDYFLLDDCLDSIQSIFDRQTKQKNLELEFIKINFTEQIEMNTDQNRLKQILINLLSNSLKFTFKGKITLKVSIQGSQLEFIIEDTGIGMPKDIVSKLFQQFATFNLGNMNQQGVGLGLVISRKLVGLLGPSENILVSSEEGIGTKFSFKIHINPNAQLSETEMIYAQRPKFTRSTNTIKTIASSQKIIKSHKVLIVDDTVFNVKVFEVILKKTFDCIIEVAFNGLEAVNQVKTGAHFDLIFMDISMPVMNGHQATKLIREYEKDQKLKPSIIIMCSAFSLEQEIDKMKQSGPNGQIEKPVSIKKLNSILKEYFFLA